MNLKEAFRYQNFLDRTMNEVGSFLMRYGNITVTTRLHKRNAAWEGASDLQEKVAKDNPYNQSVDFIVEFYRSLLTEKVALTRAISAAKRSVGVDMDAEIAINVWRQKYVETFKRMMDVKPIVRPTKGSDYRFNAEGNQVSYIYDVEEAIELDFSKDTVKKLMRSISHASDDTSFTVDQIMVQTVVCYDPRYDLTDSLEDMMEKFAENPDCNEMLITI